MTAAQPQGDGADRPFDTHGHAGPVRVHLEKSGPAFAGDDAPVFNGREVSTLVDYLRESERPVREQLEASLVAQTAKATGQLLNALQRQCFLDVMPAWARLCTMLSVSVVEPVARRYPRQSWEFTTMREAVELALCHLGESDGWQKWLEADALLRGYAMTLAHGSESHLSQTSELTIGDVERISLNATAYREFAEGRA